MIGPKYYEDVHLPGGINISHTEVDALVPEMLPDKSAQIVVNPFPLRIGHLP